MRYRIRVLLVVGTLALLLSTGLHAGPALQSQDESELAARIDRLEAMVLEQNAQIEDLLARVSELECALDSDVCPPGEISIPENWIPGTSSDSTLLYYYHPSWELREDEPRRMGFTLPNTFQIMWIYWFRLPGFVEDLLADETELRNFEAEMLERWTGDDEEGEILSFTKTTVVGKPALVWEMGFTGDDGSSSRLLIMQHDCGESYTCEIGLVHLGIDRMFLNEDRQMLRALMSSLEFVTGEVTIIRNANLRACPSVSCEVVGRAIQGQVVEIVGQSEDGDWYQLSTGEWIAAWLVDGAPENLPVVNGSPNL